MPADRRNQAPARLFSSLRRSHALFALSGPLRTARRISESAATIFRRPSFQFTQLFSVRIAKRHNRAAAPIAVSKPTSMRMMPTPVFSSPGEDGALVGAAHANAATGTHDVQAPVLSGGPEPLSARIIPYAATQWRRGPGPSRNAIAVAPSKTTREDGDAERIGDRLRQDAESADPLPRTASLW